MFRAGILVDGFLEGRDGEALGRDRFDHALAGLIPVKAAQVVGDEIQGVDLGFGQGEGLFDKTGRGEAFGDQPGAGHLARDLGSLWIGHAITAHLRAGVEQAIAGDIAALGDGVVVEVMRPGDLDGTASEQWVGVFVGNDRNQAPVFLRPNRDFAKFSNNWRVTFI